MSSPSQSLLFLELSSKLPGEHGATDFDGAAPIALASATFGFENSPIAVQLDNSAAVEEPQKSQMVDPSEGALPITTE
jgi:hypothetical protein